MMDLKQNELYGFENETELNRAIAQMKIGGLTDEDVMTILKKRIKEKAMKKLFVSVPMKGRTQEEIKKSIQKMKKIAEAFEGEELELIDSYVEDKPPVDVRESVWYLGRSIEKLADADVFIGIQDDWDFDGCFAERTIAERYGIKRYRVDVFCVIENFREYYNKLFPDRVIQCEEKALSVISR